MPDGATFRFSNGLDEGNLDEDNLNSLDVGGNVHRHPTLQGRNILITPLEYVDKNGTPKSFAGQLTALLLNPSVTTFLWVDTTTNLLATDESTFPNPATTPHIRLAEVETSATGIATTNGIVTGFTDRRPKITEAIVAAGGITKKTDKLTVAAPGQTAFPAALTQTPLTAISDNVWMVANGVFYHGAIAPAPAGDAFELSGVGNKDLDWLNPGGVQLQVGWDVRVHYFF